MRGNAAPLGTRRVSANGYSYIKTVDGWILEHRLIAENKLGRKLKPGEFVRFSNGDRNDLRPDNITVTKKGGHKLRSRKAILESRIEELQAELQEINQQLKSSGS